MLNFQLGFSILLYSAKAITQENSTTAYNGQLEMTFVSCSFRCPYQANVMKILDTINTSIYNRLLLNIL